MVDSAEIIDGKTIMDTEETFLNKNTDIKAEILEGGY